MSREIEKNTRMYTGWTNNQPSILVIGPTCKIGKCLPNESQNDLQFKITILDFLENGYF